MMTINKVQSSCNTLVYIYIYIYIYIDLKLIVIVIAWILSGHDE